MIERTKSEARLILRQPDATEEDLLHGIRQLGLSIGANDQNVASGLLGGLTVAQVLDSVTAPAELVGAWSALMGNRSHQNTVGMLTALAAMLTAFARGGPDLVAAITSRGWNYDRTKSEAAIRLFGTEFNIVRRLMPDRSRRDVARSLLQEAIATASHVDQALHSSSARRWFFGMRGVANLMLARGMVHRNDPAVQLAILEAASGDLEQGRLLGDRSVQHYEYEIEALSRRAKLRPQKALFTTAAELLDEAGSISRRLAYDAGDLSLLISAENRLHSSGW